MVRAFSNYALGFFFVAGIFIYFFKSDSKFAWKSLLPKIAIASVLINMSWFLFAVLIDFSTILTTAASNL
jgi:hypothetical protein